MTTITYIIFITFIIFITYLHSPAYALESTQSASPSATLQNKLKALQEEIASKAAKLKTEVTKKLQNKAYIGFIKSKSDTALTIATDKGTRMISISDDTQIIGISKSKAKITFKDLVVDDYLAALGDIDDNEVLTAKKIFKLTPPKIIEDQLIYGEVISQGEGLVTVQTKQNQTVSLTIDEDTAYQTFKNQAAFSSDLKVGKTIIAAGNKSQNGILRTRFVYIVTYSPVLKPKTATGAASVKQNTSTGSGKIITPTVVKKKATN